LGDELIYWKSHYKNKDIELQIFEKYKPQKTKRCNYPNSLIDKEKAIRRGEWLVRCGSPLQR
jgi:hypothetical protein